MEIFTNLFLQICLHLYGTRRRVALVLLLTTVYIYGYSSYSVMVGTFILQQVTTRLILLLLLL